MSFYNIIFETFETKYASVQQYQFFHISTNIYNSTQNTQSPTVYNNQQAGNHGLYFFVGGRTTGIPNEKQLLMVQLWITGIMQYYYIYQNCNKRNDVLDAKLTVAQKEVSYKTWSNEGLANSLTRMTTTQQTTSAAKFLKKTLEKKPG